MQKNQMSKAEADLVSALMKPDCQIQVSIPAEITPVKWKEAFTATIKAVDVVYEKEKALQPILGRLLQVAKENPETYKGLGFETFDDFLEREIKAKFEWGRATCFNVMRMVERWPQLTNQEYQEIGIVKFNVIAKAIPKGDENKPEGKRLLEAAKTNTAEQLESLCVQKGLLEAGDVEGAYLKIPCSKKQLKFFNLFFADQSVQAVCETKDKARILEAMIAEVHNEWVCKAEDHAKGGKAA